MQLSEDQQQATSVAVMAYPRRFFPSDEQDREMLDGLVEAGRLTKDGDGYRAAPELVAAMKQLVRMQAQQAALN